MRKYIKKLICKCGPALCSLAVLVASYSIQSCRGYFYQPEEPENLHKVLKG